MQEKIDENWEKKCTDLDCKIVERKEQVENNSGHIDDKQERIQVCEDLKEQNKEIENYVEEKTKIGNKMITNYRKEEYRNFQESQKEFMKNYWGIKEESVMKKEAVLKKNAGIEMNIINFNIGKDAENDNVYEENSIKEIVDMRKIMKGDNV
ncbi:hypothetical protein FQA39_LY15996 [Lamprigera yunnana]|nr:hypothetical protein FQA39_LY15996 [Lamprigera yunnana]